MWIQDVSTGISNLRNSWIEKNLRDEFEKLWMYVFEKPRVCEKLSDCGNFGMNLKNSDYVKNYVMVLMAGVVLVGFEPGNFEILR